MASEWHASAGHGGPHDPAANDGTHDDAGTAPATTADDAPAHSPQDATSATAAMGDERQRVGSLPSPILLADNSCSKWSFQSNYDHLFTYSRY